MWAERTHPRNRTLVSVVLLIPLDRWRVLGTVTFARSSVAAPVSLTVDLCSL